MPQTFEADQQQKHGCKHTPEGAYLHRAQTYQSLFNKNKRASPYQGEQDQKDPFQILSMHSWFLKETKVANNFKSSSTRMKDFLILLPTQALHQIPHILLQIMCCR